MSVEKKCNVCQSQAKFRCSKTQKLVCGQECLQKLQNRAIAPQDEQASASASKAAAGTAAVAPAAPAIVAQQAPAVETALKAVPPMPTLHKFAESDDDEDDYYVDAEMPALVPIASVMREASGYDGNYDDLPALLPIADVFPGLAAGRMPALEPISGPFGYSRAAASGRRARADLLADMPALVPISSLSLVGLEDPTAATGGAAAPPSRLRSLLRQLDAKMRTEIDRLIEASVPESIDDGRWSRNLNEETGQMEYTAELTNFPESMLDLMAYRMRQQGWTVSDRTQLPVLVTLTTAAAPVN